MHAIDVHDLSVQYPGHPTPTVNGISITIPKAVASVNPLSLFATGMRDALVGADGFPLPLVGALILLSAVAFLGARRAIRRTPLIVRDR